jgi:N-acetylcysteine deacetylase
MDAERLRKDAEELRPNLVDIRRELHRYPELSMAEFESTRRIRQFRLQKPCT